MSIFWFVFFIIFLFINFFPVRRNIKHKKNIQKQKKRHFQKIDETKEKEIIELLKTSSLPLSEISKKYSISRQRVFAIQKSKNIKRKI